MARLRIVSMVFLAGLLENVFLLEATEAQSVNLIEQRLDSLREGFFDLGPFYATPVVRLSAGYDSNALSAPDPQEDIQAFFGPGIQLGLPMGSRAFLDFYQEVDFVYYREQVDLRQVFNVTRLGGGWGGRRLLFQVHDEFREETRRPTTEFDLPVEMRRNRFESSLTVALGWRQELRARFKQDSSEIRDQVIENPMVPARLNNVQNVVSLDLSRRVSAKTDAVIETFFEKRDFDDSSRDSESYGARMGLDFSPELPGGLIPSSDEAGISGELMLGFRKLVAVDESRVDYTGFIGNADVALTFSGRHRLRAIYDRDVMPSILGDNWYFVENQLGAFFRWQLHDRFSIEPGAVVGNNDYPLTRPIENGDGALVEQEVVDERTSLYLTFEYNIRRSWFVGLTTEYLDRRSNVVEFDKGRLLVNFNFVLRPR